MVFTFNSLSSTGANFLERHVIFNRPAPCDLYYRETGSVIPVGHMQLCELNVALLYSWAYCMTLEMDREGIIMNYYNYEFEKGSRDLPLQQKVRKQELRFLKYKSYNI